MGTGAVCAGSRWRSGLRGSGLLLNSRLTLCSLASIVLIGRDLCLGTQHGDGNLLGRLIDHEIFSVSGKALSNDLHADGAASGNDIDGGLAVGIGLDFEISQIFAVSRRIEDDGGIGNGLAVVLLEHLNLDVRGRRGRLVFAATILAEALSGGEERNACDKNEGRPDRAA